MDSCERIVNEEYELVIYCQNRREELPVIWIPVLKEEDGWQVYHLLQEKCVLICIICRDWSSELSPWPAEEVFPGGGGFQGRGEEYLRLLTDVMLPEAEGYLAFSVKNRGLVGYSLAGLFAVYAMYHTDCFTLVGSISGSLWFDGWKDYALCHQFKVRKPILYISLGSREHRVKNPRVAKVREYTDILIRHWKSSCRVFTEMNPGGHFDRPEARMAAGIDCLLKNNKDLYK